MRILVISDLHLASGQLDDFDPDIEDALVEFLDQVSSGLAVRMTKRTFGSSEPIRLTMASQWVFIKRMTSKRGASPRSRPAP
jgi:hypothetical protein